MAVFITKYDHGDLVYLKTDIEQRARMVTQIKLAPTSHVYELTFGTTVSEHYEIEISDQDDTVLKTT